MRVLVSIFGLAFLLLQLQADDRAFAVAMLTEPIIDGHFDQDWGHITRRQTITALDGSVVATFRLGFDDDNLYAAFEVLDDSPLKNGSSIVEELLKGGDAVGLGLQALKGDPNVQRVLLARVDGKDVLIAMRPTWKEKRPHSYVSPVGQTDMDYVGPVAGAEAVLRERPGGYVAEIKLPWKGLGINKRHEIGLDAQVIFSDPAGTTNVSSAWWYTSGGDALTVEDLPSEAACYPDQWGVAKLRDNDPGPDPAGEAVVRARPAGLPISFTIPRDASVSLVICDENDFILREILRAERMTAGEHTVEWDGRDRYGETLPPGSYRWKLAHFDPLSARLVGTVGNSAQPPFRTADGKGSMGGQHGGAKLVAAGSQGIYLMGGIEEGHPAMRAIDADGYTLWNYSLGGGSNGSAAACRGDELFLLSYSRSKGYKLFRFEGATGKSLPIGSEDRGVPIDKVFKGRTLNGMVVVGDQIFITNEKNDQIVRIDARSGTVLKPFTIDKPKDIAALDDQTLLVVSGKDVLKVAVDNGKATPFISGLSNPSAVCVDAKQQMYIAEGGGRQQISCYDRNGKLVRYIGKKGGRAATVAHYDPEELRNVADLAIGPKGHLWVVETADLRRVASFTTDGEWLTDQFGPTAYNVVGPDLDDFSTVFYQPVNKEPTYIEATIDYDAFIADPLHPMKAWSPKRIEDFSGRAGTVTVDGKPLDFMAASVERGYGHMIAFKGTSGHRYLWRTGKWNRAVWPMGAGIWREDNGQWVAAAFVSNDDKTPSWSDSNGDGKAQEGEFYDSPATKNYAWLDRSLTLFSQDGRVQPVSIDARGVPSYKGAAIDSYLENEDAFGAHKASKFFNSMPDDDGAVYFAANIGTHRHLSFWDRACENQFGKIANGRLQWIVGQHAPIPVDTGVMTTVTGIAGAADDVVIVHTVDNYIGFTSDGLTLGDPLRDAEGRRVKVGPTALYVENFTGLFLKDPESGRNLLFSVRSGDDPILEIVGPERMERQEGSIKLDSSRPREVLDDKHAKIPYETWWGNASRYYEVDGQDWEWLPDATGLPIFDGKTVVGDVRLRRDAGELNVLANILADDPDVGEGRWGSDEGVELMLATEDGSSACRIFFAALPIDGRKHVGRVSMRLAGENSWTEIDTGLVAMVPRWNGLGWRLEASLPIAALPKALHAKVDQVYRREVKGDHKLEAKQGTLPDLIGTLHCNVAIHRRVDGRLERLTWVDDGGSIESPGAMAAKRWPLVDARMAP